MNFDTEPAASNLFVGNMYESFEWAIGEKNVDQPYRTQTMPAEDPNHTIEYNDPQCQLDSCESTETSSVAISPTVNTETSVQVAGQYSQPYQPDQPAQPYQPAQSYQPAQPAQSYSKRREIARKKIRLLRDYDRSQTPPIDLDVATDENKNKTVEIAKRKREIEQELENDIQILALKRQKIESETVMMREDAERKREFELTLEHDIRILDLKRQKVESEAAIMKSYLKVERCKVELSLLEKKQLNRKLDLDISIREKNEYIDQMG